MHFHKHGAGDPPLARLVRKLELSDTQQQSVQSIIDASAAQRHALREEMHAAMKAALSTMPDDPGYPALIEKRKELASAAIQQRSDANVQIYSLLTEEQKAQVPQLIEDMKAHAKERRRHGRGNQEG
jgi:Spy/CpxP family protein refolding chaperone